MIELQGLRVAWGFLIWRIEWCDRYLCHVTGIDHVLLNGCIRGWSERNLVITMPIFLKKYSRILNSEKKTLLTTSRQKLNIISGRMKQVSK